MTTETSIETLVLAIVASFSYVEVRPTRLASRLVEDLNIGVHDRVFLVVGLEIAFDSIINLEDAAKWITVEDIVMYIRAR